MAVHITVTSSSALTSEGTSLQIEDPDNVQAGEVVASGGMSAPIAEPYPGANPRKYCLVATNQGDSDAYLAIGQSPTADATQKCVLGKQTRSFGFKEWGDRVAVVDVV